ncbi:L,D-transpeptidase [uncultured Thiodictyon sp.]|uniref:L,D-transpeptidase n=1 Tax=uncultured Thiodictyon sp. TaxID=1846217 RepID=UPI0025CF4393|nr:L,D-transpeptidase [uncultured Thiodictyon sp.]
MSQYNIAMAIKRINGFLIRLAAVALGAALTLTPGWAQDPSAAVGAGSTVPVAAPPAPEARPAETAGAPGGALGAGAPSPAPSPSGAGAPTPEAAPATMKKPPARPAGSSRRLTIHLGSQRFVYSEGGRAVRSGPVSSGRRGYGTPGGSYRVLSKQRHKFSSLYAGSNGRPASMPYAIQFRSNYFIHQGRLPGYPASHGCVRLHAGDAQFLFSRLRAGDPIVITR